MNLSSDLTTIALLQALAGLNMNEPLEHRSILDMTHTPTPWVLVKATEYHGPYITSEWSRDIADLYTMSNPQVASVRNGGESYPVAFDDAEANAEFIVTAVNAFEANQARIAVLEKALAPFAALGIHAAWMTKDDAAGAWGFDDAHLTWGDFRRAAAALSIPS